MSLHLSVDLYHCDGLTCSQYCWTNGDMLRRPGLQSPPDGWTIVQTDPMAQPFVFCSAPCLAGWANGRVPK